MMDMHSRNQYLREVRKEYLGTQSKKEKGRLLNEAEERTGLERKHLIKKLKSKSNLDTRKENRKKRKRYYDREVRAALVTCWRIFDYPCGQRLKPLVETETDRLRTMGELSCSDETARKLTEISFRSIDAKLEHQKEVERRGRKYHKKIHPLLYQKIPIKVFAEQGRSKAGMIQVDLVEHCGQSAAGEYVHTLSTTDSTTGWWEGEAVMSRGQETVCGAIQEARGRYPFPWSEIHSDNGAEFINGHLYRYTQKEGLAFSRSRPYKKNDNCLVEQKNWTHVKKFIGYLRYDTEEERVCLNTLYGNDLRLFKNFFQPAMKLVSKERVGGRIKRKYDAPKTPYQRVMEQERISPKAQRELQRIYDSLNPAVLKRSIDGQLTLLHRMYQKKKQSSKVEPKKKQRATMVSFFVAQREPVSVS